MSNHQINCWWQWCRLAIYYITFVDCLLITLTWKLPCLEWSAAFAAGQSGRTGATGFTGETGFSGNPGSQGQPGPQGFTGSQGPKGQIGQSGDKGAQGPTGQMGAPGEPGSQGIFGSPGAIGFTGLIGMLLSITVALISLLLPVSVCVDNESRQHSDCHFVLQQMQHFTLNMAVFM